MTNTYITIDGIEYQLLNDACCDNNMSGEAAYFAHAIRTNDVPDEDGWVDVYDVEWAILDDYDGFDEGFACDWGSPVSIECNGRQYNVNTKYSC